MPVIIPGKKLEAIRATIAEHTEELTAMVNKAIGECLTHIRSRPEMVCLCGSTRFGEAFASANLRHTLAGRIVLSIGCNTKSDLEIFDYADQQTKDMIKADLDELHLCKIDRADWIHVLNVGGYIGESTEVEIAYTMYLGKRIEYLEKP